eukprot:4533601-Amphidinium_carterae.1
MQETSSGQERLTATQAKMDIRDGNPLGKRQGGEGADSLEPDLQKIRTETDPAGSGSTTGAASSSAAPPIPADMDVATADR